MKKVYLSLVVIFLNILTWSAIAQTTFNYTGALQQYTVPACTYFLLVDVQGAQGGNSVYGYPGGYGGRVVCTLSVIPGQVLNVYVGGQGSASYTLPGNAGGFNGGGRGTYYGGSGGGGSDIRVSPYALGNRAVVAGGGGGGAQSCYDPGGAAGGTNGSNGTYCGSYNSTYCGAGGTQTAGGAAASGGATIGGSGTGGNAAAGGYWYYGFFGTYYRYYYYTGGGGGGGYFGGGGGQYGSGGGGSSFPLTGATTAIATGVTNTSNYRSGNGTVVITPICNQQGAIVGAGTVCVGSTITLTNPTAGVGPTATWSSNNPAVASVGSTTGVVTGVSAGTATITYNICNACGALATKTITVNPQPAAITGTATVCTGLTTILSDATSGGTWSSSSSALGSVGSSTGIVTGVAAGTPTITYTLPAGCFSTMPITVNTSPAAITGAGSVCPASTLILSNTTSGGTWTSSNTALATVGSSSGIVTGVAGGTPVITYTLANGCFATAQITVNSLAPITGASSICLTFSITLSDATPGGTWSSSSPSIASVTSGGVVTGLAAGSAIISYNVPSIGCTATYPVAVTPTPTVFSVTGGGHYCSGGTGVVVGLSGSNTGVTYTLFNGATPVPGTVTGGGFAFNFPAQTAAGSYGIVANSGSPCAVTMSGTQTISIDPLPTAFTMSGGGSFCVGGAGVHVFLNSSTIGVNYQLFVNTGGGPTPVGSVVAGTSASIDFGSMTTGGTYTVTGTNVSTGCFNNMSGSITVSTTPLPTAYTVTGGGGYCTGGTGVTVGLSNSDLGISYQLMLGGVATGSPVSGTGAAISFGLKTTPGTYTVVATNTTTSCTNTMSGSATVAINSLPTVFTLTGGGSYCAGGSGVTVGLNGSQAGVNYQLYNGVTLMGAPVSGTGVSITFGLQTLAGSYTVVATNATTGCVSNMSGSASITINALPTSFSVTGGGSYCNGTTGVHVGLSGSVVGTTYSLLNGATVVGAAGGTGSALDFGIITVPGFYTVSATITATGCVGPMSGTATVVVNPLPTPYTVTGGGSYCAGGAGMVVGLSNSALGINYQLLRAGIPVGAPVAGTGSPISFGLQTAAGSYTVVATNATTTCVNNMTGSVLITINPLPTIFNVTGGGGYCVGTPGVHIGLSGSDLGVSYQLRQGVSSFGAPVTGTGAALDFGVISAVGSYSVAATNSTTGCVNPMAGTVNVSVNNLPTPYAVTGGGNYCAGGSGVAIGLANSGTGTHYQLMRGISTVGSSVAGSGSAITFGLQTVTGTYTVVATNDTTGCTNNMTGTAVVGTNPLPFVFTVGGGGSYCAGGSGLHVTLSGSTSGINYSLNLGGLPTGTTMPGTGAALDFGLQTAGGTYTVTAINPVTSCTNIMSGSVTINVNPLPGLFLITGGGNYCTGGAGVHVGLTGSAAGINYQLYVGVTPVGPPLPGTGSPLDFGLQTAGGTYTVLAANSTTGCSQFMTGSTNVVVNALPAPHNVTGGGNYCPGGAGVVVGLDGSNIGTNYQLWRGATAIGTPVAGTGAAITFGLQSGLGIYTVVATNTSTSCSGNMTGSVTVALYPLPTIFNVTGGGNYCPGGTGVHVGLSGSAFGVNYQLYLGGVSVGGPVAGTGYALDFGLQSTTGTYTIVATNATTTCNNTMNGTAVVGISPLPAVHNVTGGGNYCAGGTGVHIGLDGSDAGNYYQLYNGTTAVGSPMAGTGLALDFGLKTAAGTYTVVGSGVSTGCNNTMTGSVAISIDPLPTAYSVTGGGSFCAGGTGSDVMLSGSDVGTNYQLYNGATPVGTPMGGTGSPLDFGLLTTTGIYMVVATNTTTMCNNNMTGSAIVNTTPLPTPYIVTGGGNYCAGGSGVHVMVSSSDVGTQYQLMNGGSTVGAPLAGTGFGLDFGLQTAPGTYSVIATNTLTSCVGNMSGSVNVNITPLPTVYSVSGSGSSYCAGGAGIDIALGGSQLGINYQLYNGVSAVGSPMPGTGLALDFGYVFSTGVYTVVAVDPTSSCTNNMAGTVSVNVSPLPMAFTVTGGGSFCSGGNGVVVGLSGSNVGVSYQLYLGTTAVGGPMTGTGFALNFGLQTAAGAYTVKATNTTTTCVNTMSGSATVAVNPLPATYSVTGGGNYCAGGSGVHVGLSGSVLGSTYQLQRGGSPVGSAVPGTGFALDFGSQTIAGTYTVLATINTTSCSNTMAGSAVVGVSVAPVAYNVIGGGNYCPGGVGVHVGMANSNTGVSYQLYNGTTMVGSAAAGTGTAIDFGLQTATGIYTVVATNVSSSCSNTMTGSVTVGVSSLPDVYSVIGGGHYCAGGAGAHIGLTGSGVGISYQAYNGLTPSGAPVVGTGGPLDLGLFTTAGSYTVIGSDGSTSCSSNMTGSATIASDALVTPAVTISTGEGDTVCSGHLTHFTAMAVNGGGTPSYQWTVNGIVAGTGNTYSYIPANGDVVGVTLTSSANCATPSTASNSKGMTVNDTQLPSVTAVANPGLNVCQGTIVNFTATPLYGGSAPVYSWMKNSVNVGSGPTFSYTPADGDEVYVMMSSNYHCRLANNVSSTHMTLKVDLPVLPIVNITAHPGNSIAAGQTVTFVATVTNGGPTPSYQWLLNGATIPGATLQTYTTSNLMNGDTVTCQVLSSGGCSGLMGFNNVGVHVSGVSVKNVAQGVSDIKLIPNPNNGVFTVKGTLGTTVDEEVTLEVTDLIGQVIHTSKVMTHNGEINEKIQLNKTLANGMYILNLRSGSDNKVFHVVIEQ